MWLLWLALLLPMGQSAASWHALSHTRVDSSDADGKQALHQAHCDLCLTAAAVSGGAMPSQAPALPHLSARHAAPQAAAGSVWLALPALAYLSRAPPRFLH
jgi:hypothetical protein